MFEFGDKVKVVNKCDGLPEGIYTVKKQIGDLVYTKEQDGEIYNGWYSFRFKKIEEEKKMACKFYVVLGRNKGGGGCSIADSRSFETKDAALASAKNLARGNSSCEYIVVQTVCTASINEVTVTDYC